MRCWCESYSGLETDCGRTAIVVTYPANEVGNERREPTILRRLVEKSQLRGRIGHV